VARLVFRAAALRNLADIAAYIERESGSGAVAEAYITRLTDYCENLATLPGLMGRDRSELRVGYRSANFGNHVVSCATWTKPAHAATYTW